MPVVYKTRILCGSVLFDVDSENFSRDAVFVKRFSDDSCGTGFYNAWRFCFEHNFHSDDGWYYKLASTKDWLEVQDFLGQLSIF